jgi:hypothetical protein
MEAIDVGGDRRRAARLVKAGRVRDEERQLTNSTTARGEQLLETTNATTSCAPVGYALEISRFIADFPRQQLARKKRTEKKFFVLSNGTFLLD